MPHELPSWAQDTAAANADVVKVVGMAHDATDAKVVLDVLAASVRPTIAIAMGQAGVVSRVLSLRYDSCFLTFAAPPSAGPTAPGQVSIVDMGWIYRSKRIGPKTSVFGVVVESDDPSTVAPLNAEFDAAAIDAVAVPFRCTSSVANLVETFR